MHTKRLLLIIVLLLFFSSVAFALTCISPNYSLKNARIAISGGIAGSPSYSLTNVQIGKFTSGQASSPNYSLDAGNIDKTTPQSSPNPPTVNPVTTPTNIATQTLSGSKEANTSIYINGYLVVPINLTLSWSYSYALSEGDNYLIIAACNNYGLKSSSVTADILLDTSAPTKPSVSDDGAYTASQTQLHACWTSSDPQTGIVEYQYAIGTTSAGTDVIGWTSAGTQTEVTRAGLSLIQEQNYYISVKAKNAAGSWSQAGSSDGIKVNQNAPQISSVLPPNGSSGYTQSAINFSVTAYDADGDSLFYQFSLDGNIICPWQGSPNFSWPTSGKNAGIYTIKVEVSDNKGGIASQNIGLCLFRKPPVLPSP